MKLYIQNRCKNIVAKFVIGLSYYFYHLKFNGCYGQYVEKLFKSILSGCGISYLPILSIEEYKTLYNRVSIVKLQNNRIGVIGNVVQSDSNEKQELASVNLHDIRMIKFSNVIITGNSDMVVDNDNKCVISDYCYNIKEDVVFIDGLLYRQKKHLCTLRTNFKRIQDTFPSGIMISGKFSTNYYHQAIENLNRIMLIDIALIPEDVPIIIDESVLNVPSFKCIFELLKGKTQRAFITIKPNKLYCIESLYCFDHINNIAPHTAKVNAFDHLFVYDPIFIKRQRDILLTNMANMDTPKRIFISRQNSKYRHFNEKEVFDVLKRYEFQEVCPELYTFEEQIALFYNAEFIVGGTGAAFTNLVFCNSNCKVICLISRNIELPIFSTIAYINGAKLWYYSSDKAFSKKNIHGNYYINVGHFEQIIKRLIN